MAPKPRPWFRMYTETIKDRKIRRLDVATRWLMVACFSIARESPRPGWLLFSEGDPYLPEDLQDAAALTLRQVNVGLKKLQESNVLEMNSGSIRVVAWDKRQYEHDSSTERSRRSRAKSAGSCNDDATLHQRPMQRPPSVQKTDTENRYTDSIIKSQDYSSSGAVTGVADDDVAAKPDYETLVLTAKLVGKAVAAERVGVANRAAYAAKVTQEILKGDDPTDLGQIRGFLEAGMTPEAIAGLWGSATSPLDAPKPRVTCGGCVNGMTFDEASGTAARCHECNPFPKLEVVQ